MENHTEDIPKQKTIIQAVKPIELMSYLITLGSRENDVVVDPFVEVEQLAYQTS